MNKQLEDFARSSLKSGLAELGPASHRVFRLMYGRDDGKSIEAAEALDLDAVVDAMPTHKLDFAMTQVENSTKLSRLTGGDPAEPHAIARQRTAFEKAMIARFYRADMFDGFPAEDEWTYYDPRANVMWDAWQAAMSTFVPCGWVTGSGDSARSEDMFHRLETAQEDCDRHNAYWAVQPEFDEGDVRSPQPVYRMKK